MSDTMLVRLKPHNPRRGFVMKTYVDGLSGAVFKEERGWYEVPTALAEKLREITSRPENPESPLAFDVCTRDEAVALERRIRRAAQERASASDPFSVEGASRDHLGGRTPRSPAARDTNTLTTADLAGGESVLKNDLNEEPADANDLESDDLAAEVASHSRRTAETPNNAKPKGNKGGGGKGKSLLPPGAPDGSEA